MQNQIAKKRCTVCGQFIYLDPNVLSSLGNKVSLNENGLPHDSLHAYIHKKALEIRLKREYLELLDAISEESELEEML